MAASNHSRYDHILRRIEQRRREQAVAPKQDDLASVLDAVNAWGFLEELRERRLRKINLYGPKICRGYTPAPWAGVVVWYKRKGYYHYQTLTLLGIWAFYGEGESILLTVGAKALEFAESVFNPESYYHHIKRRFDLYYHDDGSPPPESGRRCTITYREPERLAVREAIQREVAALMAEAARRCF